jgi:hypothetical protein
LHCRAFRIASHPFFIEEIFAGKCGANGKACALANFDRLSCWLVKLIPHAICMEAVVHG